MLHELKTWPKYFNDIKSGLKTFEIRKHDRPFKVGDILELKEFNPDTKEYTENSILKQITYILSGGNFGIDSDYVILGIDDTNLNVDKNPTLGEMINDWLKTNGYDGLLNEYGECACEIDDLFPCGYPNENDCQAGYKTKCDGTCPDAPCDFHISYDKENE